MSIYAIHITLFYGCAGRIAAIDYMGAATCLFEIETQI